MQNKCVSHFVRQLASWRNKEFPGWAAKTLAIVIVALLSTAQAWAGGVVANCNATELAARLFGGGPVTFSCNGTITLSSTVTISSSTTIDATGHSVTISGNNAVQVFVVDTGVSLSLNNLTIANGKSFFHGGGVINNGGFLTVTNSTFSGNAATNGGGGGGIFNGGFLTVTNTTFSGNSASGGAGGGILNGGPATITNSTFYGNSANTGGGIANGQGLSLINTILAGSTGGGECAGIISDGGYNLSDDATCSFAAAGTSHTVSAASLKLGTLGSNGGPTQTVAPGVGSVAIDAIPSGTNGCGSSITTDQRGQARPQGPKCDIGAVEMGYAVVGNGTSASCSATALTAAVVPYGGVVKFNCPSPTTITLTSTITVPASTFIDGINQSITISGNNAVRVFMVDDGAISLGLNNLTIANGKSPNGSNAGSFGGGIVNNGTLTVTNSTFSGNSASCLICAGGAIVNFGTVTVTNSTFSGNSASGYAGGIFNEPSGFLTVVNSTFAGNSASASGGGILNSGSTTITNSTFVGNTAITGGGIFNSGGTVTIKNTILEASAGSGGECSGTITDGGYNLSDDATCSFAVGSTSHTVLAASLKLGTLASNGGPTQTIALGVGSVAIDAIPSGASDCGDPTITDQRGIGRLQNGNCDIGAYEAVIVGSGDSASCTSAALQAALAVGGLVVFNCGVSTTIPVESTITISTNTFLDGIGQSIVISGNSAVRVFLVNGGVSLSLNNLTIANGRTVSSSGGGIANLGTLTVTNSTFSGNSASGTTGGGIFNTGTLTVTNSTFSGNSAAVGGGIANFGTLTVTNSTFSGNSANGANGGGIFSENPANVVNSTATATMKNTILAGSGGSGGACAGPITDGGYNRSDDATCSFAAGSTSHTVLPATLMLGTLRSNGGPTQTIALGVGSVATDAIPNGTNGCGTSITTDQRGIARPQNSNCDIGAVEVARSVVGSGTSQSCSAAALSAAVVYGGVVKFNCPTPTTITLTTTITITSDTSIDGTGQSVTLSGNNAVQVFTVYDVNLSLSLINMPLVNANGSAGQQRGGAILNYGTLTVTNSRFSGNSDSCACPLGGVSGGGAIFNLGTATVTNSTFSGNSASCGVCGGGAISNLGTLTVANSTFSGNSSTCVPGCGGGAIFNGGTVTVTNSTFSANSGDGGGIFNRNAGLLTVVNSTFSGNSASGVSGGGIYNVGTGGGTVTIKNTILAGSGSSGGACSGPINDGGYNLSDDATCSFAPAGGSHTVLPASLRLGTLGSNGGPTQTIALGAGSVAIDAIPNGANGCGDPANPIAMDQRGIARPQNFACDIGAFEFAKKLRGQVTSN